MMRGISSVSAGDDCRTPGSALGAGAGVELLRAGSATFAIRVAGFLATCLCGACFVPPQSAPPIKPVGVCCRSWDSANVARRTVHAYARGANDDVAFARQAPRYSG